MRRAAIILLIGGSIGMGLFAAVVSTFWFYPESLVRIGARAAHSRGIELRVDTVEGSPRFGWTIDGLSVRGPAFGVSARRLRLDLNWRSTLTGRPAFDLVWIDGLNGLVRLSTATVSGEKANGPPTLVRIDDLKISDSAFAVEKPGAEPFRVTGIGLDASVRADSVEVRSARATVKANQIEARGRYAPGDRSGDIVARIPGCLAAPGLPPDRCVKDFTLIAQLAGDDVKVTKVSATVDQTDVAGHGQFRMKPLAGEFSLSSKGPVAIRADVRGDQTKWNVVGSGATPSSRFDATAAIDLETERWTVRMTAAGIPAELIPGLPKTLGALSATLEADGTGKVPAELTGAAKLAAAATNGPRLTADIKLLCGDANGRVAISSGGIDGDLEARWSLKNRAGDAVADLSVNNEGLRRWLPGGADGKIQATVSGPQNAMKGRISADIQKVGTGDFEIDSVSLKADGTAARHTFDLSIARGGAGVSGGGVGGIHSGIWRSTWTRLDADVGQPWNLDSPFRLAAGGGGAAIDGLRLVSEGAELQLDGGFRDGRITDVRAFAKGVKLDGLAKLAGSSVPVAGMATAMVRASGKIDQPVATVELAVAALSIDNRPAGDLSAVIRTDGKRVFIDHVDVVSTGGRLTVSGNFPISFSGRKIPPFTLHVKTDGLDPAALPLPTGGYKFDKALLKADLTVSALEGKFRANGLLNFDADAVTSERKNGTRVAEVHVSLVGDGESLRIERAESKGGNGVFSAAGKVTTTRADLSFKARGFDFRHEEGIFVRLDSDLTLTGPWESPRLEGRIDVAKGEIKPVKNGKKKEKEAKPAKPPTEAPEASALGIEIKVTYDRDVWYRDGQSAIETKGDLEIRKEPGSPTLLFGTVETTRGDYIFYGRSFEIQEGRVTFNGESPPDPRLQLRALYTSTVGNVKVWIDVTGTARDPRVALSSQPPMDETDIISVLVTGTPLGAESQGTGTEAMARSMAANYLADQVRQRVQDKFSVDVLRFNIQESGDADVTIGENLGKDLYVSYGQTLGEDAERRVNAEYILTPRYSLRGETTSVGRYVVDLLFRFGFY